MIYYLWPFVTTKAANKASSIFRQRLERVFYSLHVFTVQLAMSYSTMGLISGKAGPSWVGEKKACFPFFLCVRFHFKESTGVFRTTMIPHCTPHC
jgi:hypothetical protein